MMEVNGKTFQGNEKRLSENSTPPNEQIKTAENSPRVFVNHAAIAWNESRSKWIGNVSQKSERPIKDSVISWSTTYEELLTTYDAFPIRIPLPVSHVASSLRYTFLCPSIICSTSFPVPYSCK